MRSPRRFLFRWLVRPLLIVSLPLVLILAGAWYWLSTSLPETEGQIAVAGLAHPVEIIRDKDGIPHIFAQSETDAAFALGFVHAQDRLWQMEQMRRVGAGRLAEIVGMAALPLDRIARTYGFERLAEAALANLHPDIRAKLDAYAAGVNAYLDHHHGAWPPEFVLLSLAPEHWRPVDSLLWGELISVQLSGHWRRALLRAHLLKILPAAEVDQLWPPYPDSAPTTLAFSDRAFDGLPFHRLAEALSPFDHRGASNAWAVSGAHSSTGKPLLANDPHLPFSLPGLWYLVSIDAPGLHVAGASVAGVPLVILGHNDHIAWGMTTTGGNVEDLFIEKLDPQNPGRYLSPEGSLAFRTRTEQINVRGAAPVTLTVRETRHGPVISDVVEDLAKATERGTVVSLAATWMRPDNRIAESLYHIDKARNWDEFVAALRDFGAPEQNLTYADVDGHIGFYAAGWVPIRKAGDGRLPVPGWSGAYDWAGTIPFEALPHELDPPVGRLVNANNKVTPPGYPYAITIDGWDVPYRAERIDKLLASSSKASVESFAALQADAVSLAARQLLPFLTDVPATDPRTAAILERLRAWDGTMARGRPEPLIYAAWLRELDRLLFADKLGEAAPDFVGTHAMLVHSVFTQHPGWCAKPGAPPSLSDCRARSAEALQRALAWITARYGKDWQSWRWGEAHRAQFRHRVFERVPVIGRLIDVQIPADGGVYTVNRGAYDPADDAAPFADVHGAGYRAIYDLADLSNSRFMIEAGESGNPFSRHFTGLARRWRDFDYVRLAGSRDDLVKAGGQVLTLVPR
ncbi:MAG TPA: penicillin acylase family protein [Alphaproteobacteria bacterium]|nr:penicillin acylase family protein [Alphaproteobacteria bacterium]